MLRKIQEILLRKIQISMKIVPQNTAKHLSTSHHDSYDIFRVSNLLDIQQQFYCLIVSLYPRLYVCRQSYCSIVCHNSIVLLFHYIQDCMFADSLIVLLSATVCIHKSFRRLQVSSTIVTHNTGTAFLTFCILQ